MRRIAHSICWGNAQCFRNIPPVFCLLFLFFRKEVSRYEENGSNCQRKPVFPQRERVAAIRQQVRKQRSEQARWEVSFNRMTVELMESRGFDILALVDVTGISRDTIKNMRNRQDQVFSIRYLVAFCIALHLDPAVSALYIRRSPVKFLDTEEMDFYRYALDHWYGETVPEVNRRLIALGVKPLTDLLEELE